MNWGYDYARRNNLIENVTKAGGTQATIASYAMEHDFAGHPSSQTVTGAEGFAGADRTFVVDDLDRLVGTHFADTGEYETNWLDLVGNREMFLARSGAVSTYTLADGAEGLANQYGTINGQPVVYDAAGNLIVDEVGRRYSYDEQNRLTEVRKPAPDDTRHWDSHRFRYLVVESMHGFAAHAGPH
ncbi:MAG: hypothetical protein AMXMBFR13_27740 [Phycisphaerae bacterium]